MARNQGWLAEAVGVPVSTKTIKFLHSPSGKAFLEYVAASLTSDTLHHKNVLCVGKLEACSSTAALRAHNALGRRAPTSATT